FEAEDGIRYWSVTGVQTCALPICLRWFESITYHHFPINGKLGLDRSLRVFHRNRRVQNPCATELIGRMLVRPRGKTWWPSKVRRSEERRVGKEGGCRWCTDSEEIK